MNSIPAILLALVILLFYNIISDIKKFKNHRALKKTSLELRARAKESEIYRTEVSRLKSLGNYKELIELHLTKDDFLDAANLAFIIRDYGRARQLLDHQKQKAVNKEYAYLMLKLIGDTLGGEAMEVEAERIIKESKEESLVLECLTWINYYGHPAKCLELLSAIYGNQEMPPKVLEFKENLEAKPYNQPEKVKEVEERYDSENSTFREKVLAAANTSSRRLAIKRLTDLEEKIETLSSDDQKFFYETAAFHYHRLRDYEKENLFIKKLLKVAPGHRLSKYLARNLDRQGEVLEAHKYFQLSGGYEDDDLDYEANYKAAIGDVKGALDLFRRSIQLQEARYLKEGFTEVLTSTPTSYARWKVFELESRSKANNFS